jgi:hypothetical protein
MKLNPVEAHVERVWFQLLKVKCDEPLSDFAFNFNLRRYSTDEMKAIRQTKLYSDFASYSLQKDAERKAGSHLPCSYS